MTRMWVELQNWWADEERGASLVEYGLLVALIAVVALVAVRVLGTNVSENLNEVASAIE
ncbi:MAG: Flp family type IVb pilin [Acidimicrobiia bacterium]|nr:Flp family type IVb pilin [Acidimicrobiia bacterium]NNC74318.1 Flp family type IVb pilin [Acidimicrobiia bacterium]